jgi:Bacterial conjugation TrbI-like protein
MTLELFRSPRIRIFFGILGLALGLAVPALAQDSVTTSPGPANSEGSTQQQPSAQQNSSDQAARQQNAAPGASATAAPNAADTASATAKVAQIEVPSGTHIPLVLHNGISTRTAKPGDPVYFETVFPIMIDGKVVIPAGSYVSGEVTESKRPGRVKGRGELMIKLTTMILPNAYMVNLNAVPGQAGTGGHETVNSEGKIVGDSGKKDDLGTVLETTEVGTGVGAGVGAAAGHVGEGAGIGAAVGAATGLAAVLLTRGPDAEMPRGSTVEAVINRPIFLDTDKVHFTGPGQASALAGPPNREPQRSRIPF